jgi:acetyl esterase/lipase
LFTGTNEILYPDLQLLHKKLKKSNVKCDFVIGEGLTHDYPLYIKRNESIKRIIDFINSLD